MTPPKVVTDAEALDIVFDQLEGWEPEAPEYQRILGAYNRLKQSLASRLQAIAAREDSTERMPADLAKDLRNAIVGACDKDMDRWRYVLARFDIWRNSAPPTPAAPDVENNDARRWQFVRRQLTQCSQQGEITPWLICLRADAFTNGWTYDQLDELIDKSMATAPAAQKEKGDE
jgi:hypothetical protein